MKCIEHRESQEEYPETKMQILAQLVSVESEVDNGKSKRGRGNRARVSQQANGEVQIDPGAMRIVNGMHPIRVPCQIAEKQHAHLHRAYQRGSVRRRDGRMRLIAP